MELNNKEDEGYYPSLSEYDQRKRDRIIILDTKWKRLIDKERVNYGISQTDMYQMYAYSKKYRTPEIWLLYPENEEMRGHEPIKYESGDGTTIHLHFVNVDKIEDSLRDVRNKIIAKSGNY